MNFERLTAWIPSIKSNAHIVRERLIRAVAQKLLGTYTPGDPFPLIDILDAKTGSPLYTYHSPGASTVVGNVHSRILSLCRVLEPKFEHGEVLDWKFLRDKFPRVEDQEERREDWLFLQTRRYEDGVLEDSNDIRLGDATTISLLTPRDRVILAITQQSFWKTDDRLVSTARYLLGINKQWRKLKK